MALLTGRKTTSSKIRPGAKIAARKSRSSKIEVVK